MDDRLRFLLNRIREKLWIKPLIMCVLSIAGAFLAKTADDSGISEFVPNITLESLDTLLSIMSSSMLVIATFAVASMVSAYASASTTATPRAFSLVLADDVSQNALSTFIGAFIFSIVAMIALKNSYYDKAGLFALFSLTLFVLTMVIITFVRWVDRIARLGRLGGTIAKAEKATESALLHRRREPRLRGVPVPPDAENGQAVHATTVGYIQRVDVSGLQSLAEKLDLHITVAALPGTFRTPADPLAHITNSTRKISDDEMHHIAQAFVIGHDRLFDEDPRFGLIVLSEIASRALSPAVNDPGTAIDIIGTLVRLFALWDAPPDDIEKQGAPCDRIAVPELSLTDMFDDAFSSIARDGAGTIEVACRLQKALASLAQLGSTEMRDNAIKQAELALSRAELAMTLPHDIARVRALATSTSAS